MSESEQSATGAPEAQSTGTSAARKRSTSRKAASAGRKASTSRKKSTGRKASTSRKKSATARKSSTRERKTQPLSAALIARVKKLSKGGKTLQEIADALNKSGEKTARGLPWTTQNVWHVLRRK